MFDLDHFKRVNDSHGHHVGDRCIVMLADVVKSSIRQSDLFARFGGEEFVLLLPETNLAPALQLCERLRQRVEAQRVDTGAGEIAITVSVGLADFQQNMTTLEEIIARADAALYAAKRNGRNQVAYGSTVHRDTARPCHPASIGRLRHELREQQPLARPIPRN
jgi:diguanylate cyclase (GGDEF)-like protein